ncbi:hypothetical protein COR50_11835 [Chitinophaga caeni]|uniref:DUF4178 domain-containing protein n=1 Tax=Chitinophaga caeni TaxID=2029983 RepID=A0A291QV29_9BACT|nr:hypothetical protein [Chitinophaga caeni]ATL47800.1 hypothetical protein COR50_11835 [Chitinophaga caeni]
MKTIIHKFLVTALFLIVVATSQKVFANASQPGVWNAGGTVYTMLYPEDSLTFKKVQMQQERIYIQLYKGYAVVKGEYIFKNTTSEKLNFKMGYPVNGIYSGGDVDLNQVQIDQLNQFKIKANAIWLSLVEEPNREYGKINSFSDNWKVWQMEFLPDETKNVAVYFIVNTNNGIVRKGYEKENYNAFIYLLESGSVWKNPIEKGSFYVQLMDGLQQKDVKGLSDNFGFQYNESEHIFWGNKTNFSPTPKDNLIVTYSNWIENFQYENSIVQSERLFAKVDELSSKNLQSLNYTTVPSKNPYEVESTFLGSFPGLLTLFVIYAPFIIGIIVVAIVIWAIVKWRKIKRNNKTM